MIGGTFWVGKNIFWEGGKTHTLFMEGTVRVGTPHNIEKKSTRSGRWVDAFSGNIATLGLNHAR